MDNDPWLIQSSKGRTRPAPVTLGDYSAHLPGLSQIEPKVAPAPPPPPVPVQSMSRQELERGMDLIQGILDKTTDDDSKRAEAERLAATARVPWRPKNKMRFLDGPKFLDGPMPISETPFKFGTQNTCRGSCCGDFRGPSGGM